MANETRLGGMTSVMETESQEAKDILAEGPWLEKVARHVVGDADRSKDVAQDTLISALAADKPGGWLRRIALNSVRMDHRSRFRRQTREEKYAAIDVDARRSSDSLVALHKKQASEALWPGGDDTESHAEAGALVALC